MRTPLAIAAAVATASAVVVAGTSGSASADLTLPSPSLTPLPTVSVPVPVPTPPPLPLPSASLPAPGGSGLPGTGNPGTGNPGGGGNGAGSPDGSGTTVTEPAGSVAAPGSAAGATRKAAARLAERKREKRAKDATPMVAGTPQVRDLLDDENSPQLLAASQDFLAADQGIAEIARQKRLMARLKQTAREQATTYRTLDMDVLTARVTAESLHERHEAARRELVAGARKAYASGQPTTDGTAAGLAAAVARLQNGSTRADIRLGELTVRRDAVRADFERTAASYKVAKQRLADANERLATLAAQRSTALDAVRAARGSDVALHQARLAESGQLGAQIQAASAAVERAGRTVQGTGNFVQPAAGHVTSPFGMRFHPILHYNKLHTGTDFAGGDLAVRAADDGRVLMTVVSEAYGNFTVIDHGVVDGKRVTTAYAHQAVFLVREGQAVSKGDQIGVIGSTGYSTGPHLHFEVREDGTVVDPITWLARR
jgi:murein DD-endopeptidase MepM/ murein hydrolase activator NlpD